MDSEETENARSTQISIISEGFPSSEDQIPVGEGKSIYPGDLDRIRKINSHIIQRSRLQIWRASKIHTFMTSSSFNVIFSSLEIILTCL